MRYFCVALFSAGVTTLWWTVFVFGRGKNDGILSAAIFTSVALVAGLIMISWVEDKF